VDADCDVKGQVVAQWLEGVGVRKEWMLDRQTGRTSEKR